jgi:pimeloyl-ACP methyl ester carboxylesterase
VVRASDRISTFALVHGAWHGSWCWERLVPFLREAGHDVIAPDLPCDDGSFKTFGPYADVVCDALTSCDGDVIVVGHSLAGPTATLVAARRPVRRLVYLCAAVPEAGRSLVDQWQEQPDMVNPRWDKGLSKPDEQLRLEWVGLDAARELLFADCDEETVLAAFNQLRPQSAYPFTAPLSLSELPAVRCTSIVCEDDELIYPAWSIRTARHIGAELVRLPGGHSPFLSRPSALADILIRLAESP